MRSIGSPLAVSIRIGTCPAGLGSARTRRHTSRPSMSGSIRSSTSKSGIAPAGGSCNSARPALPSSACVTPKPERSRYSPTICARRASSSIICSCCMGANGNEWEVRAQVPSLILAAGDHPALKRASRWVNARAVASRPAFAQAASGLAQRHGIAWHTAEELAKETAAPAPDHAHDDAPVLLVFTSGTTGTPKAAVHTQANLAANMRIAAQSQAMSPTDVVATMLPLFHVGGLCIQTLPALGCGAHVDLLPRFAPDAAFDAIERHRATLTLQVPA